MVAMTVALLAEHLDKHPAASSDNSMAEWWAVLTAVEWDDCWAVWTVEWTEVSLVVLSVDETVDSSGSWSGSLPADRMAD